MSQAVSRWPFMAEARIQSQAVHIEFVVGRVALGQIFLRVLPIFSFQYHSTNAPFSLVNLSRMLYNLNNIESLNKTLIFLKLCEATICVFNSSTFCNEIRHIIHNCLYMSWKLSQIRDKNIFLKFGHCENEFWILERCDQNLIKSERRTAVAFDGFWHEIFFLTKIVNLLP